MKQKQIWFAVILAVTSFFISLYVESVSNGKMILLDKILSAEINNWLLNNEIKVIVFMGLVNLILYIRVSLGVESRAQERIFKNICQKVFDDFIKPDTTLDNSKYRVSLFKAKKRLIFRRVKWFLPEYRTVLINVGRYQTTQETRKCRIKFLPKEGAVGNCYHVGTFLHESTSTFSKSNSEQYYQEHKRKFSLPKFKARQLRSKVSELLCCPINIFRSDLIFGVVVIDSTQSNSINHDHNQRVKLEKTIANFSVFFNNNEL